MTAAAHGRGKAAERAAGKAANREPGQAVPRDPGETAPDPQLYAVIMAGGGGTRFWPLSRRERPKQFLAITGERSLLQTTWERALGVVDGPDRIVVVTSGEYAELTREQLPELPADNLLLEPQARNTAPCIAWATASIQGRDPEAAALVMPADHLIHDREGFGRAVRVAVAAARRHHALVTFGIPPRYPETGYGYIEAGKQLSLEGGQGGAPEPKAGAPNARVGASEPRAGDPESTTVAEPAAATKRPARHVEVFDVVQFREKPDLETATEYLAAGNFFWNSGIFVWTAAGIRAALAEHLPEAAIAAAKMLAAGDREARAAAWAAMPATSIDFGVMEKAGNVVAVKAPFDWSDVGSWAALHEVSDRAGGDNVAFAHGIVHIDASGNLVHAPGSLVALLGVDGLAVIDTGDVLLVASLKRSQDIKLLRERLVELGLEHLL
ncbi:MAG TPA: sugar phosphate nucleotidyltransferase [Acidobacteriota bacterium]